MSIFHDNAIVGASGQGGYFLSRSLRFRSSASAYITRTPSTPTNQAIWTWSSWVKRGSNLGSAGQLFAAGTVASNDAAIYFETDNTLIVSKRGGFVIGTTQVFRDPSSWYHIVVAYDSTQGTSSNRLKIYVNGIQVTALNYSTYPTLNETSSINSTATAYMGKRSDGYYFDGYYAETNFIDGQALTPSSFGETSSTTGVWKPKKYSGTYGTNGFYLPFTDNSALTSGSNAGLGKDFSGNGNYWTTNNISITSGATYDSMTDVPTLTDATSSNYCVINPLDNYYMGGTISDGNLQLLTGYSQTSYVRGTQGVSSGKWYYEVTLSAVTGNTWCGVGWSGTASTSTSDGLGGVDDIGYVGADGSVSVNNTSYSGGPTYGAGDTLGVMIDLDNNLAYFSKNGTLLNSGNGYSITAASATTTGFYYPAFGDYDGTGTKTWVANFGQRPFAYTPPTGFKSLNIYNLPTPTIGATASSQANKYMDAVAYTGDGSTSRTVSGYNFQPDFVWAKGRSNAEAHNLADAVRGFSVRLYSNLTNAEESNTYLGTTAINGVVSNGFTTGSNSNVNANGTTYVGWCWKANGSGSSNTSGSITSTVSVNTTSGFSIVTYSGTNSQSTVGHGLGAVPKMIIVKARSGGTENWAVYHASIGAANKLFLNLTNASTATGNWQSTTPTSTVFYVDGASTSVNASGWTYVAYCFAEVAGFSKFGSYTGNGSTDGVFVYTGFKPKYVLWKRTDAINSWIVKDGSRNPYNAATYRLYPDQSYAQDSGDDCDFVSNGFKIRSSGGSTNASGGTYIYMAFAENPFKYSLAR